MPASRDKQIVVMTPITLEHDPEKACPGLDPG
jgi:hypothetical protein